MSNDTIRTALEAAIGYLSENPDDARSTDSFATATLEEGLRCVVRGPDGMETRTDMVTSVGGTNTAPSPGWLLRAATASCVATLIVMKAALEDIELGALEVTVDSESDDQGILGIKDEVPAGPLSVRIRVKLESNGSDSEKLRRVVLWAHDHCPLCDLTKRSVPINLETEIV
jgi:uncharacterized OsmC-like protein